MGMDRFEGLYYDGQSSRAIPVVVMPLQNDQLLLRGEQLELCQPLGQLRWEQPPGSSRPRLHWPGGGLVEVNDDGQLAALFAGRPGGRLQGLLRWAESHRAGAVGASLLAIGTIAAVLVTGLPLLATGVSAAIPAAMERQLGVAVLASLDKQSFAPSQLPMAKHNPIQGVTQGLVGNAYSRAFEHQADREALAVLRRLNLTPTPFFSILDKLERQQGKTNAPSFLLTHPSNRERRARASGT